MVYKQVDQEDKPKKRTETWTDERKKAHSQKIRELWIYMKTKKRLSKYLVLSYMGSIGQKYNNLQ